MSLEAINVTVLVSRRQMLALGWKSGRKIASRDDIREYVNGLFGAAAKAVEEEYRARKKATQE